MVGKSRYLAVWSGNKAIKHFTAPKLYATESHTVFKALGRIYAHHSLGKTRAKTPEHRITDTDRHTADHTVDHTAYRVTFAFHLQYQRLHLGSHLRIRTPYRIAFSYRQIHTAVILVKDKRTHLRSIGPDRYAPLLQSLPRKSSGHNPCGSLTRA